MALNRVAMVVRQLVRGNAVANIVFVPRYHEKPGSRAASDAWRAADAVDLNK